MRSRAIQIAVVVVAAAGLLTAGVGSVAASHGGAVDDTEIVEVQTVSDDSEQGVAHVELRYHIGDDVASMRTRIRTADHEVVELTGFSPTSTNEYEWDEQTSEPTIEARVPINESSANGYDYVDAGEWLITDRPLRTSQFAEAFGSEPTIRRLTTAGDEGVAADGMIYLGEYESHEFSAADEQFELVISEAADPELTVAEVRDRLITASDRFDGGGKSDRLTVFAVSDPLRRGGLATSTNAAFWVHEAGLAPSQTTLYHEYVHSRQAYERTDAVEWTIEGSADYFGQLLALKDGAIEYHRFHQLLDRGNDYDGVVLADRDSWARTNAAYELGALTLAAMDERLRDGGATYADLFRAKNEADSEITDSGFESLAAERGTDVDDFFDRYIRSAPPGVSVPDPTVYDGPNDGAELELDVPELNLDSGATERVTVALANTGSETSLAPQLSVGSSDAVDVSLVDSDGAAVTETEEGWVFDHLPAGDTYGLTLAVGAESTDGEQIQFSVGDLSDQRDSASATLDSTEPLAATLDVPAGGTAGETVNVTAATTPDDADIDAYSFTISAPDGERTTDSSAPTVSFTPAASGEYAVSVTATATDGRTATADGFVDVAPAETDDGGTEDSIDDGTADDDTDGGARDDPTGGDATDPGGEETGSQDDEVTNGADDEPDESDGSIDGVGDGFGPTIVVVALVALALLARRRAH